GAIRLLIGSTRLIARDHRSGLLLHQILGALQLDLAERLRGPAALERALRLLDRSLEETGLDAIERRAGLDQIALLEQNGFEVAGDARPPLDAVDRLNPPDEVERFGDRLLRGLDDPDRPRRGLCLLRIGGQDQSAAQESSAD